jgi:hypothetical protein
VYVSVELVGEVTFTVSTGSRPVEFFAASNCPATSAADSWERKRATSATEPLKWVAYPVLLVELVCASSGQLPPLKPAPT